MLQSSNFRVIAISRSVCLTSLTLIRADRLWRITIEQTGQEIFRFESSGSQRAVFAQANRRIRKIHSLEARGVSLTTNASLRESPCCRLLSAAALNRFRRTESGWLVFQR